MIHAVHLRQLIIDPTLKYLDMYSPAASNLMMGTAAQESHLGYFLMQVDAHQRPQGPAIGIFQMEPATFRDIWRYLDDPRKEDLKDIVNLYQNCRIDQTMIYNFQFATVMARLKYWMDPESLPQAGDIEGLAHIWKRVYNTAGGKGTVEEFTKNYQRFVMGGDI